MTEGSGRLAEHLRHVGAVDEEDLVVAIDHGDHVRVQDIWRSALAGQRSICFWCRVSLVASESNKTGSYTVNAKPSLDKTKFYDIN